jgi:hypothetical protein
LPFLVHGVTRASSDAALPGDAAVPFDTVTEGPLVGLVSETDEAEALPTRANLLHHTKVLEQVGAHATVLPMRFGVVVPDREALVADFLVPERDDLLATLDRLEGHVELRLRGTYDEAHVIRDVLDSDPRAAQLRGRRSTDAKMELGERIVAGIDRRREHDLARVGAALEPHAAASSPSSVSQPLDAFSVSFLVAEDGRAAFESAVDELGGALAPVVSLELVGPVPPFSFADRTAAAWG